jgi:hypothetical protein
MCMSCKAHDKRMRCFSSYGCSLVLMSVLQEARQLAEHWRREADAQRKAAASARAPETARHIKQLQDSNIAARAALLEKDAALAQVRMNSHRKADAADCRRMLACVLFAALCFVNL